MSDLPNGTLAYRVARLEREHDDLESAVKTEIKALHEKLDRITLAIITGALGIAAALVAVAVTIVAQGP